MVMAVGKGTPWDVGDAGKVAKQLTCVMLRSGRQKQCKEAAIISATEPKP